MKRMQCVSSHMLRKSLVNLRVRDHLHLLYLREFASELSFQEGNYVATRYTLHRKL